MSADGSEVLTLVYDLEGADYRATFGPAPESITRLDFVLFLANDYRVDALLDDVFVATIGRPGNVQDLSIAVVRFGIRLQGMV